ncbi:MAG: IS3 family transposase [Actinomycetota bacterium]|nr:IS3 family transposase [Actinomycetota bacterium]
MNVYPFIEAEKAGQGNVVKACKLLEVSRSAFYEWHHHQPSASQIADEELAEKIKTVWDQSKGTYGWPRVHAELRRQGTCVSRKRVARLMRRNGLTGRCRRRWTATTISDPTDLSGVDLIKRAFGPGTVQLDQVYVGDITYIWTWQGWAYLATVIDLASRKVVGWALADHMRTELVADALRMALTVRRPAPGLIFHSDRGTQYTSGEFTGLLAEHKIRPSLSRPRQCWDNAVAEAWFGSFKREVIERRSWATHTQLRRAVFEYIEVTYNRNRLHSSLGYLTPNEYEAGLIHQPPTAHAA